MGGLNIHQTLDPLRAPAVVLGSVVCADHKGGRDRFFKRGSDSLQAINHEDSRRSAGCKAQSVFRSVRAMDAGYDPSQRR